MVESLHGTASNDLVALLREVEPEFQVLLRRFRIPAHEADDIIQDAALALLTKGSTVLSPRPWLISVVRNRCILYWRRRRRTLIYAVDSALLEELGAAVEPEQPRSDLRRDLGDAMSVLTPRCKRILHLRYGLEYTGPEIASHLGARVDAVRQATLRCLSALCRCLTTRGMAKETA